MRLKRAYVLLVITTVTLLFALATGHPMFWRSFYVLATLLVIAATWVLMMGLGVDIEVRRLSLRASAGGSIQERVLVKRRSGLQRGWLELSERTTMPTVAPIAEVDLGDASTISVELEVPCPSRGLYQIGPLSVSNADPFGLFQVRRTFGTSQNIIVHPATTDLPGFVLLPADLPGDGPRHIRSNNITASAFGVREYDHGDGLSRISWKATAHHGRLMVKEFEIEPANNVWVLVDLDRKVHSGTGATGTEETAISVAASVCRRYGDANYPVGFMAWGSEPVVIPAQRGPGHIMNVLDAMSGLHAAGTKPLLELIGDLHAKAGRYTSVAIVTTSASTEWLDGVGYLLERRSRITVVVVKAETSGDANPSSADQAAALGVPTYVVRRGQATQGLTPLLASPTFWDPAFVRAGSRHP